MAAVIDSLNKSLCVHSVCVCVFACAYVCVWDEVGLKNWDHLVIKNEMVALGANQACI